MKHSRSNETFFTQKKVETVNLANSWHAGKKENFNIVHNNEDVQLPDSSEFEDTDNISSENVISYLKYLLLHNESPPVQYMQQLEKLLSEALEIKMKNHSFKC